MRAYKTEINPNEEQKRIIHRTIGVCRFLYNFYLSNNKKVYETTGKFVSGMEFSKWLNNDFIPYNESYKWIKEVSSKSAKQSIMNADRAFRNFFKGKSKFPKFKKKNKSDVKMYFVKTDSKSIIYCERHRIKIPTLGWVQLKEKGYIPVKSIVTSGTVSYEAGRYYVSVLTKEETSVKQELIQEGIGIDLGLKEFAVCSDGKTFKNINKTSKVKKLEKKLKREQKRLSRKYENLKIKNKNEREVATRQNIQKQVLKVQKLHKKLTNIRTDYVNKVISEIVKTKPSYITIEDLNVSGMMKNRHLSKAVTQQKFYEFRTKLISKANSMGIEVRLADRFYPSSKMCHECEYINRNLKLSDRVYICPQCGKIEDRDYNASLNLRDAKTYKIAS